MPVSPEVGPSKGLPAFPPFFWIDWSDRGRREIIEAPLAKRLPLTSVAVQSLQGIVPVSALQGWPNA